jgi:16S rRNA (uracil1498-N3)-methyltransferase
LWQRSSPRNSPGTAGAVQGINVAAARFFLDFDLEVGHSIQLPDAVAHHAQRVLRLRANDAIMLFNGRGGEYAARIGTGAQAHIERFDPIERESPLSVTLIQALIAGDKLDWVIEKAVELGVARIIITPATRSVARVDRERIQQRCAHWQQIVVAACCQCGRNRLASLRFAPTFGAALAAAADTPQRYVLAPDAPINLAGAGSAPTAVAVGPEGGFTDAELHLAEQRGFVRVRWGQRIMRTETAGLAALAALQTLHGDGAETFVADSLNGVHHA